AATTSTSHSPTASATAIETSIPIGLDMLVDLLNHRDGVNGAFLGASTASLAPIVVLSVVALGVLAVNHIRTENVTLAALGALLAIGFRPHGPPVSGFQLRCVSRSCNGDPEVQFFPTLDSGLFSHSYPSTTLVSS